MTESQAPSATLIWEIAGEEPATWRFNENLLQRAGDTVGTFVIGESEPRTDWPRLQPGPLNEATGFRRLSTSIAFVLDEEDADASHTLEVSAREGSGPCPDLVFDVNGHRALLIPDAHRDDRRHAPSPPSPTAGVVERDLGIPPGILRAGQNLITITTVAAEDPDPVELVRQQRPDLRSWFGSTLQWLRLALTRRPPTPTRLDIRVTPLFVEREGGLRQLVDVIVFNGHDLLPGTVELTLAGRSHSRRESPRGSFGDARFRFEVAEFEAGTEAVVRLACAAQPMQLRRSLSPGRKWTVHVLPHVHLDIGYTDAQAKVIELHSRNVDKALDIAERTRDYAYSVDGAFVVQQFMRSRTAEQRRRLVESLRGGGLSTNAFWALLLTGAASLEDLYRSLYFAARLRRDDDVPITYANLTDVPSYSWAVPSVLAAAGIPHFLGIANHTRGGNADSDTLHLASPVRWRGPDGGTVLAFFADCYTQLRLVCADPPTMSGCAQGLTAFIRRYERPDYRPDHLPLVGTHSDNEDLSHGYADLVSTWTTRYAWPRLRFSTVADYFAEIEPLADQLAIIEGDGGSYWEDGLGTQAIAVATLRQTQAVLPGVEAVTALVTSQERHLSPPLDALDEAWECLLYGSEHTWTSAHATTRPHSHAAHDQLDWKVAKIRRAARIAQDEGTRALSQLAEQIQAEGIPSLLVVNPTSWTRDLFVDLEIEDGQEVVGPDGQALSMHSLGDTQDGLRRRRVRVPDLPGFGYRLMPLRERRDAQPVAPLSTSVPPRLETPHYVVGIDEATGQVTGLHHLAIGRDLLAAGSPWRIGDVLYARGGGSAATRGLGPDEVSAIYDYDPALPPTEVTIERATLTPSGVQRTPWGWLITSSGSGPTLPSVTVRIELFDDSDRVEVDIGIEKLPELAKESIYIAFPFLGHAEQISYERQQGWVDPAVDHLPGACQEWFTTQNAVAVSEPGLTVSWASADAPLFTIGDVVSGTWATSHTPADGALLSWVMNNYWMTNTPAQQEGHARFRYAFRPSSTPEPAGARRMGRELRSRAMVGHLQPTDRCDDQPRPRPRSGTLYRTTLPDNVELTAFCGRNAAEIVMRLQELGGRTATTVDLAHPCPDGNGPAWAATCTATEDPLEAVELDTQHRARVHLAPWEVVTVAFGCGTAPSTFRGRQSALIPRDDRREDARHRVRGAAPDLSSNRPPGPS